MGSSILCKGKLHLFNQEKEDASKVKNFRPISLTTLTYKLVAKVLAEKLEKIMPSIIDTPQSAFLEGRQIIEYRAKKKKGWLFKLDLEKVFDRVNWDFLEKVMVQKNSERKKEMKGQTWNLSLYKRTTILLQQSFPNTLRNTVFPFKY